MKRYDLEYTVSGSFSEHRDMVAADNGEWVRHEDATAGLADLHRENKALRADIYESQEHFNEVVIARDELRAQLNKIAPYTCPHCGPHTMVDEDECCATCGADCECHYNPSQEESKGE